MNYAHRIQQFLVDDNAIANGDFTFDCSGKVVDVLVECLDDSGYSAYVGWNEKPTKDLLIPGKGKAYGVPERGFLDGQQLTVNFGAVGAGFKRALVTVWRQGEEIC